MKPLTLFFLAAAMAAAASSKVDIYSAKDLQSMSANLDVKDKPYGDRNLARYGNHYLLLIKREKSGSSELHEHEADVFVVEEGSATILTGGKMLNPHTLKPGEIRGSGIEDGERHTLAAGDIIHIPAGVPHQLLLDKGAPFAYFVVKVSGQ